MPFNLIIYLIYDFIEAWQANMDIQFCLDNYAVITYITDYLTKGDAGLTKELRKALLETKHCNNFDQLNYLKLIYFKHKQVWLRLPTDWLEDWI